MSLYRRILVRLADFIAGRAQRRAQQRIARREALALDHLRSENPSCSIDSTSIVESHFGHHVVVGKSVRLDSTRLGDYASVLDRAGLEACRLDSFSYVSYGSTLVNCTVGRFCSIGQNVRIGLAPHPTRQFVSMYPAFYAARNSGCALSLRDDTIFDEAVPLTRIEHDVWIGADVLIPGGIHVATGAAIAAGSVVVKDVPPYAIVGGNPARMIRYRFDPETIASLLASEWWNWSPETLRERADWFSDATRFVVETRK